MLTNGFVTVWHQGVSAIYRAHTYNKLRVSAENGGAVYQNELTVRIPTKSAIEIECGDWIGAGIYESAKDAVKYKVVSVTANLYGMNKHYKVVAV